MRFCWHNWGVWKDYETRNLRRAGLDGPVGVQVIQYRTCAKCKKKQVRHTKTVV